jgi:hypothetical protein
MLHRKALLIAAPGSPGDDDYLDGVDVDIRNWQDFLTSPLGGRWYGSEVVVLREPSARAVREAIADLATADYSFLVYTGHGHLDNGGQTFTCIGPYPGLSAAALKQGAPRRTVVMDCCRQPAGPLPLLETVAKAADSAGVRLNATDCRRYFDGTIAARDPGCVALYACSPGELANENERTGGWYTHSLMQAARDWLAAKPYFDTSERFSTMSVIAAHRRASTEVQNRSNGEQTPNSDRPRVQKFFPFCIIA